jgi:hypothetical protein
MSEETKKRIGKLYREGYFKNDPQAKKWSEEYAEKKVEVKVKKKGKK